MVCPYYQGNKDEGTCDLKSKEYGPLAKQHIENFCNLYFTSCSFYTENLRQALPDVKIDLEQRMKKLEAAQRKESGEINFPPRSVEVSMYEQMR